MKKRKFGIGLCALLTVAAILFSQFAFAAEGGESEGPPIGGETPQTASAEESPEPEPAADAEEDTGPDADTESKPDADTESKPDADTESKPDADTESKPEENDALNGIEPISDEFKVTFKQGETVLATAYAGAGTDWKITLTTFRTALSNLVLGENQVFVQWESGGVKVTEETVVTKAMTVTPVIKTTTYKTVTFYDSLSGGTPLATFKVETGTSLSAAYGKNGNPAKIPDKPSHAGGGSVFCPV